MNPSNHSLFLFISYGLGVLLMGGFFTWTVLDRKRLRRLEAVLSPNKGETNDTST